MVNYVTMLVGVLLVMLVGMTSANLPQCMADITYLKEHSPDDLALMVDSTGKGIDDLGKWDECRDLGHISKYCTVRFAIPVPIPTPYIGLCLPVNCTVADIGQMIDLGFELAEYKKLNITEEILIYKKFINYENKSGEYQVTCAHKTPSPFSHPGGAIVIIFSIILAVLVILGSLLEGYHAHWWPEEDTSRTATAPTNRGPSIQDEGEVRPLLHKHQPRSKGYEFFVAFSLVKNFKALVGPSPPSLSFLNGLRAISITWVILGHSLDYMNYVGILNFAHVITKNVQGPAAQVFPGAEFSVDTFFWLSGFLGTFLTVQELKNKKRVNWFLYYFHRVWRLSPAYFYALFFYMCVSVYLSDGPFWPIYMNNVDATCGKYWWTNLIYVNNFIPNVWKNQCFLWGWYLAVDMQLYILAPFIYLLYNKNKIVGWAIVILGVIGCTVANGIFAHVHQFVWNAQDPHEYMGTVYGKPYTRATPWLLGIACAFLYLEKRQLNRLVVYIGWAVSATIMLLCVYGPSDQFQGGSNELDPPKNTWIGNKSFVYFTFSKLGWSLALSFLMYSMAMGWGGFIRRFLGAAMWNPLARLTYSTYLFHPIIMFVVYYSHLQYFSYDQFYMAVVFVGIVFLSFSTAVVMFLFLERPMVNMEKMFLPHKKH